MTRVMRTMVGMAALLLVLGGQATAANQTILVGNDKTLSPASVTIGPGDIVTWQWVGPDTDHIIASQPGMAESWDSDPGFDDINHAVGDTFGHTFTHTGAFPYVCRIHPDKMFGTITVEAPVIPTAAFTATPDPVQVGATVTLNAGASTAAFGRTLVAYEWDLDGNGSFETSSGAAATLAHTFTTAGVATVGLRVVDNQAASDQTQRTVTVTAPPPPPLPPPSIQNPLVTPFVPPPANPVLTLTNAAKQASADTRGVVVSARCDLNCSVVATGVIKLPKGKRITLPKVAMSLTGGVTTRLTMRVPLKLRAGLRAHLVAKRPVTAAITVTQAGTAQTKTIKLTK